MAGFAKSILVAMLAAVAMVIMMNVAFFFPWYINVIETCFEVSQIVANENYLPGDDYHNIYGELSNRPIFNKRNGADELSIEVTHQSSKNGKETECGRTAEYYYDKPESEKPYVQKGNPVTVTVKATYPFQMNIAGNEVEVADIPVEISINTMTLKYYKDLEYYVDW